MHFRTLGREAVPGRSRSDATLQRHHRLEFVDSDHQRTGGAQVGRSGDTMICGLDVAVVLVSPLRALCITTRWVCGTSQSCWGWFTVGRGSVRLGLQLVWSEQDGECSGSDLDVWRCISRA